MASTAGDLEAQIDACALIGAALSRERVHLQGHGKDASVRLITSLAEVAATAMRDLAARDGLDEAAARVAAAERLQERIIRAELALLDYGRVHGPARAMVTTQAGR